MSRTLAAAAALFCFTAPSWAHRLDEYLQATLLSVEKDRMYASMRLIPGVAVSSLVISSIDTNADGVISAREQKAYAESVLHDLSLRIDGHPLTLRLLSVHYPNIADMKEGLGEIQIECNADLPPGGVKRNLIFENHHHTAISAYLVNVLVPAAKNLQITAQNRNETQSFYQLSYTQSAPPAAAWSNSFLATPRSLFRLGIRHIAEGTDHLLFLLALLLPSPLLSGGSRWARFAPVRQSLLQILKVVTAFTVGHSLTLALAALGFVHVPNRPIEALIAVSVLVSAVHAWRPLFPGREALIAAFFGLIHGLAFANTLHQLGLSRWERVAGLCGFNLGIETMQLLVVLATMPSLLLFSRTPAYPLLRRSGALFAGAASLGWLADRLFGVVTPVDALVESVAQHALWIAGVLFFASLACYATLCVRPRTARRRRDNSFVTAVISAARPSS